MVLFSALYATVIDLISEDFYDVLLRQLMWFEFENEPNQSTESGVQDTQNESQFSFKQFYLVYVKLIIVILRLKV